MRFHKEKRIKLTRIPQNAHNVSRNIMAYQEILVKAILVLKKVSVLYQSSIS